MQLFMIAGFPLLTVNNHQCLCDWPAAGDYLQASFVFASVAAAINYSLLAT